MGSRRLGSVYAAMACFVAVVTVGTLAPALRGSARSTPVQAPPLPKAFVLVDADTGAVIAQQDVSGRAGRRPARSSS